MDQVRGYPNAVFRKFYNRYEAEQYYSGYFDSDSYNSSSDSEYDIDHTVYTDGATLRNGSHDASSGIGVYYGPYDSRNRSVPLSDYINGLPTTNQRAELLAIKDVLIEIDNSSNFDTYLILSDSLYAINCITKWLQKWERNGYLNVKNEPVHNRDIIEECVQLYNQIENKVFLEHVRGHQGNEGNEEADRLAKQACYY